MPSDPMTAERLAEIKARCEWHASGLAPDQPDHVPGAANKMALAAVRDTLALVAEVERLSAVPRPLAPPTCHTCEHFNLQWWENGGARAWGCSHPTITPPNLQTVTSCLTARSEASPCGPQGSLWTAPKDPQP